MDSRLTARRSLLALAAASLGLAACREQHTPTLATPVDTPSMGAAAGVTAATVSYTRGGRQMVYVNNPEKLLSGDLAHNVPSGQTQGPSLLTVNLGTGEYRDYFEHLNATGDSVAFGVYIYNPTSKKVVVTRRRKGFAAGDYQIGARPFQQLNSASETTPLTLDPAANVRGGWIFRSDVSYGAAGQAAGNQFLTGVFDFDINVEGGVATDQVIVHHLVYRRRLFTSLPGTYKYIGYITRDRYNADGSVGDPEHRTYKGVSPHSTVTANLAYTFDTGTTAGALPVTYSRYGVVNSATGEFGPVSTVRDTLWYTHDIPARDKTNSFVTASDMLSFTLPGWPPVVNPLTKSSYNSLYPNLGNWGATYSHTVTVTNNSGRSRNVVFRVGIHNSTESDNSFVAYQGYNSGWTTGVVRDGASITTDTVAFPTGTTSRTVSLVMGAPADGRLFHKLVLID
ncbi:MAG TPA: hypothetical protein VE913_16930 [Longimicrobium sp.]|nr:hypothetical protein [Longimicrobium sp.]